MNLRKKCCLDKLTYNMTLRPDYVSLEQAKRITVKYQAKQAY